MPDKQHHTFPPLPVSNYSSAIARAVQWLGDRYLLARPINGTLAKRQFPAIDRHRKDVFGQAASRMIRRPPAIG